MNGTRGLDQDNDHPVPRKNWAGNVIFGARRIHKPQTVDELRRIVAGCGRIRALGCGHSFSNIVDTAGDLVLLSDLPQTLTIDTASSTVTVAAGTSYTELTRALHQAGYALANMASIPHISIAGACATGTHGSGDHRRVLADSVSAIQLIVSDGDLVELRRDIDRDRFHGSVVALGALGIVTAMTLDIEPAYEMTQRVYLGVPLMRYTTDSMTYSALATASACSQTGTAMKAACGSSNELISPYRCGPLAGRHSTGSIRYPACHQTCAQSN